MESRIARIEGAHDGVKQSQSILVMSVMGLAALFFALAALMVTLLLDISGSVSDLDAKLDRFTETIRMEMAAEARATRQELSGIATAIATGITAARQPPPLPAPTPPPRQ